MKKLMKTLSALIAVAALVSMVGCSKKEGSKAVSGAASSKALSYADVELGKTGTDISATIKLLTHRTDMLQDGYSGVTFAKYLAEFNKVYPNIKVEIEGITDYASVSLLRLQGGNWGDIMMIPAIDKKELKNYFVSFGDLATMEKQIFRQQEMHRVFFTTKRFSSRLELQSFLKQPTSLLPHLSLLKKKLMQFLSTQTMPLAGQWVPGMLILEALLQVMQII